MKKIIFYFAAVLALLSGSAGAATFKQQEWLRSLPILMVFDDSARTEIWRVIDQAPKNQTLWFVIHHAGEESYRSKALRLVIEMNCADAKKRCEVRSLPYVHPVLRVASAVNIFDVSQAVIEDYERDPNRVPPNWPE
jgi:hypothetical protein